MRKLTFHFLDSPKPMNGAEDKCLTKFDIGSPMPLADGVRDEVAKKWMITDIKDISKTDLLEDMKSGPDSGITSGGQTMKSSTTKAEDMLDDEKKSQVSCSECGMYGDKLLSTCSCSMFGTVTPASRSVK